MKKIYLTLLTVVLCSFCFITTNAQRKIVGAPLKSINSTLTQYPSYAAKTTADCDTINYPVDPTWTSTTYLVTSDEPDYVNGTNSYEDKQKADSFDLSGTSYTYLTSTYVYFGNANSSNAANLSKVVYFRVYDDNGGTPGNLLATEERTLADIKTDVDANVFTNVIFTTPVALPASKKFYVSVDISNFSYLEDSIWIAGTLDGEDVPGQGIEQWSDDSWNYFNDPANYDLDVTLWIFPVVSNDALGCAAMPVKLLSFDAQRLNEDVTLSWKVTEEINMSHYEIQRADNNNVYRTVATVQALNSLKDQSYLSTDINAFTKSSAVQYRLKQVDKDGSFVYSKVINVKSNSAITNITFQNPFTNSLNLQLSLATPQLVSINLYDLQGKLVYSEKEKIYNAGLNTISMPNTANLKNGVYMLKLVAGTEPVMYKVVKQ